MGNVSSTFKDFQAVDPTGNSWEDGIGFLTRNFRKRHFQSTEEEYVDLSALPSRRENIERIANRSMRKESRKTKNK